MLSVRHYIQLIAIIFLFGVMFLYLNVNSRMEVSRESINSPLSLPEETDSARWGEYVSEPAYYVVFSGGSETEQAVYENVCLFMEQMKLPFAKKEYVTEGELLPGIALIFCNTAASEGMEAGTLGNFIRQGGKALFAAGLPEGYTDSYLTPLWGIVEKGNRTESREWKVGGDFFPAAVKTVVYPEFQASTKIRLAEETTIYVEDEAAGIPIVYQSYYGEGSCLVINGTLMQDRDSGGVLAAALGALKGELFYPVIGSAVVFLEDFPFIMPGYDKNCMSLYGRSMESFERDSLWPVLVSYASNYGIRYTMNLSERQEEYDENLLNEKLLSYLVKENLRYEGEVMLGKYYKEDGTSENNRIEELFRLHFPNYEVQAFAALSGWPGEDRVRIVRGDFQAAGEEGKACDFDREGDTILFPALSSGYRIEDTAYRYVSGLTLYGVISHKIPIENFITTDEEKNGYEAVKRDIGSLLGSFGSQRNWLSGQTVSEAAGNVGAYLAVIPEADYKEDRIEVSLHGFTKEQKFLLRTNRRVTKTEGGQAYRINHNYYCIEAESPELTLWLAE